MAGPDILDIVVRLRREGRTFCLATVVRTADVTSAKAGAKAVVSERGEITGHLGGACVQRALREAAADALRARQPRLIRVKPAGAVTDDRDVDGVPLFRSGCPSGGTVDILIEPYRQPSRLVIVGNGPIAEALAEHASRLDLSLIMPDRAKAGGADEPLAGGDLGPEDFIVIAAQGQGDLAALRAAATSGVGHIAMVASRRKAETLRQKLASEGIARERLDQVKSPAGLDLGAIDPEEIAIAILAEIIQQRNADRMASADMPARQDA